MMTYETTRTKDESLLHGKESKVNCTTEQIYILGH